MLRTCVQAHHLLVQRLSQSFRISSLVSDAHLNIQTRNEIKRQKNREHEIDDPGCSFDVPPRAKEFDFCRSNKKPRLSGTGSLRRTGSIIDISDDEDVAVQPLAIREVLEDIHRTRPEHNFPAYQDAFTGLKYFYVEALDSTSAAVAVTEATGMGHHEFKLLAQHAKRMAATRKRQTSKQQLVPLAGPIASGSGSSHGRSNVTIKTEKDDKLDVKTEKPSGGSGLAKKFPDIIDLGDFESEAGVDEDVHEDLDELEEEV